MPFVTKYIYYMNCFYNKKYNDYVWIYFKERETTYIKYKSLLRAVFSHWASGFFTLLFRLFSHFKK